MTKKADARISEAGGIRRHVIISFDNQKTRGPFQDALALLVGMVSFRFPVVKDGAGERARKTKGIQFSGQWVRRDISTSSALRAPSPPGEGCLGGREKEGSVKDGKNIRKTIRTLDRVSGR
jgi:hypothetical protein